MSEGDDVRQHSAVKDELHALNGVLGGGVLPDDGEEEGFVPQKGSPEGKDSLPGWGKVHTFSEDVGEGSRSRVLSAHREVAEASGVPRPVS